MTEGYEKLAVGVAQDLITHLTAWVELNKGELINFHSYRMRFLSFIEKEKNTIQERIIYLCERIGSKHRPAVIEAVSDKMLGAAVAKFMFARILVLLNEKYLDIMDNEKDKVEAENKTLNIKLLQFKHKLGQH